MHMLSSFKILIEDLRTSGCHLQKIENYCQNKYFKIWLKASCHQLYGNNACMIHFQTYGC
jgi:hypothetical protein